jgi:hypothetical protein
MLVCCIFLARTARAAGDDLEAYRERFRVGYEKYQGRDFAGAIVEWESIYRELGPKRGYRLAFNLGRAYDAYGDPTRAAESYESYIAEVEQRRSAGETLEETVERQEKDARTRLSELAQSRGRIRVVTKDRPVAVQIDTGEPRVSGFTAYVTPGEHTITFEPGTNDKRSVTVNVKEGGIEEVSPPPEPRAVETPKIESPPPPPPPETRFETVTERPYSPWFIYGGAALSAATVIVPIVLYQRALGIKDDHDTSTDESTRQSLANQYDDAKSLAYASIALPATLAAITGGLTAYYFYGKKERVVPIAPTANVTAHGASVGIGGAF